MDLTLGTFNIRTPLSKTPLGKWLEIYGGNLSIGCMNGIFHVEIEWKKLHSYSDRDGEHAEHWRISRHGEDLVKTLTDALATAERRSQGR